jgi:hypothetical protein
MLPSRNLVGENGKKPDVDPGKLMSMVEQNWHIPPASDATLERRLLDHLYNGI